MKQFFSKHKLLKTIGIATAALTLSVATIIGTVSAQEPGDGGPKQFGPRGSHQHSELHSYFQEQDVRSQMQAALAEVLGVTVEDLATAKENGQSIRELAEANGVDRAEIQAAQADVRQTVLAQAVADGIITQEEADQLAERRGPGFGRPRGHRGGKGFGQVIDRADMKAAIADALGLSVEDLETARTNGQTLPELAEQQGVDLSTIQEAQQAVVIAAVEQALADGTITQEQADRIMERVENGGFQAGPRGQHPHRPGRGFRGGFGTPQNGTGIAAPTNAL